MNFIKRLIPGTIKTNVKFLLYRLLKIPFSKSGLPLSIINHLDKNKAINFLDIGANVGQFSESLRSEYRINKGIIIEPLTNHAEILNKKFNNTTIFKVLSVAIATQNGTADFYINEEFDSISSLLEIDYKSDDLKDLNISIPKKSIVTTRTLDSITEENFNQDFIDLIKIDVQGGEHLILKSGIDTLKRTKLVYTEFSYKPLYKDSSIFNDLYQLMYERDFMLVDVTNGYKNSQGELLQGDALFINKLYKPNV